MCTDDTDNSARLLVRIGVAAKSVETLRACGVTAGGNVTITSITPNSSWAGTVVAVIKGTNFGMAVGFENGSGPAPVVSNVTVQDSSTIALVTTVKSGGERPEVSPLQPRRAHPVVQVSMITNLGPQAVVQVSVNPAAHVSQSTASRWGSTSVEM
jgi:hypothetical protein